MKLKLIFPFILLFSVFIIPESAAVNKNKVQAVSQETGINPSKTKSTKQINRKERKLKKKLLRFQKFILPLLLGISLIVFLSIGISGSALFGMLFLNLIVLIGYFLLLKSGKESDLKLAKVTMVITIAINVIAAIIANLAKNVT